ncbi:HU domain-containing protein [Gelidibacter maritimus]|uniref:HU-CCDC81 and SPOR domain-containing protein n=1 Tax=Gelidibacter maritimus TaxID=2761487 RepID=A0A7W2R2J4_9FLAO|nr:SPOR domain-containing protein [Gelidibacter maritimus]MBA6151886.1 HU-CCDC81 and SPOR domain-containing protein [Gelidibacter maritimus]
MHIETYISDLLYRYDCVTIPEFGAFLTKRISAKIDESNHTFFPPKKAISFNEQIQHNDGLLASYIADSEGIPYEVAVQKISKKVKSIKAFLSEGETLSFSSIGDLVLNNDGKIVFEPSHSSNYLTEAFGLSEFSSSSVKREVYRQQVESLEDVIPISITPERRTESKTKPYLKYAAVALIALTIGGFAASNFYNNQVEVHNQMAQEEANEQLDVKVQEATFVIENPLPAATLKVEKQQGKYHIIAGAFRIEENSDKKVEQLQELGFKARKIGVNKYGLHEVVYSSYENSNEALVALRDIRQNYNKDAWLLVRDLK